MEVTYAKSELAPIVLFTYNRPLHTRQTVEALRKNELAAESELIVFSDGPKNEEVRSKVEEVRKYLKTITGFKRLQIYENEKNCGLANSIIDGVTKVVTEFGRVIVLEDDLVTSPFFLRYMNEALNRYEKEDKVISIHGYVDPVKTFLPETFFIKGADCWGWATWKRGWNLFEKDGLALLRQIQDQGRSKEFDFENSYDYTQMLKDQIAQKNNSWAIRWYASAFLKNKLTLYPGHSLVWNIGIDGSGTHCGVDHSYGNNVSLFPIIVNEIEILENLGARKAFSELFRERKGSLFLRLLRKTSRVLCRIKSFIFKRKL